VLKYPLKSHRKKISYPKESSKLAEFIGAMIGDGGINSDWQVVISLGAKTDMEYGDYIEGLIFELFGLSARKRIRKKYNTLNLVISSINLVDFLISKGLVKGNKIEQKVDLPDWIWKKRSYQKFCMRGLMDTDGGVYEHLHKIRGKTYCNRGMCFTSASPLLIDSVYKILENFKFSPKITDKHHRIYLYKKEEVDRYFSEIGTSNFKHQTRYNNLRTTEIIRRGA